MGEGFIPIQTEVAQAIEETLQSLPPPLSVQLGNVKLYSSWVYKLLQQLVPLLSLVDQ